MRVLIGDSDAPFLEILQSYLCDCGHEAEIARDGVECSEILNRFTPDVVVLSHDLLWGGYQGVIAKMSEDPLLWDIPVIQIWKTSYDVNYSSQWGPPLVGWLRRPFRMSDLLDRVTFAHRQATKWNGSQKLMS